MRPVRDEEKKTYLGDAVYASYNGYHIVLTTEDGVTVSNRIFLEPDVFNRLGGFVKMINVDNAMRELKDMGADVKEG
jgi:hypothetical protein